MMAAVVIYSTIGYVEAQNIKFLPRILKMVSSVL